MRKGNAWILKVLTELENSDMEMGWSGDGVGRRERDIAFRTQNVSSKFRLNSLNEMSMDGWICYIYRYTVLLSVYNH